MNQPADNNTPAGGDVSRRYGKRMLVVAWIAALALLFLFFQDSLKELYNPNTVPESQTLSDGRISVTLLRNHYGHYVASGSINGQEADFLVDTGASDVSVPSTVARRLHLVPGAPFHVRTANGTIAVYRTHLDSVALGDIRLENLSGSINPHMGGDSILLGMEFLKHLDFEQAGKELTLVQREPN